jgi:hypothetical protein
LTTHPLTPPPPDFVSSPAPRKKVLWKWSLALTSVFLIFLMWQCGSALLQGHTLADAAVHRFHQQLNQREFEQIGQEADEGFNQNGKSEELLKFLEVVHRKLGDVTAATFTNIRVNATTNGTFVTTDYQTTFSNGSGVETFTWIKKNGALKLYGYHVDSKELIFN